MRDGTVRFESALQARPFRLLQLRRVLEVKDVCLINGAAAIRNVLKASAAAHGVQVLLQIQSHEEEAAFLAQKRGGIIRLFSPAGQLGCLRCKLPIFPPTRRWE